MCGIAGKYYYGVDRIVDVQTIEAMTDALAHRGPDDRGFYQGKNIGLGHRRLSIIDLSPAGHQPMCNEDGTIWVVFNGEIYNYKDLRAELEKQGHRFRSQCDTEVIVHAYEQYRLDFVKHFDGMFAFALWDESRRRLVLARDRLGIKPLYYYSDGSCITFASEIKSLLEDRDIPREVDLQALSNFLTLHYVPSPRTMFKEIHKVEPGHLLVLDPSGLRIQKFWDLITNGLHLTLREHALAELIYAELKESVRKRLQSDVPIGALLSGGLDSSAVLGLMTEISQKRIPAFTVGYSTDGNDRFSEFRHARLVARHFQSEYYEIVVTPEKFVDFLPKAIWYQDEPLGEPASVPLYFACKLAKDSGVTVLLTGEGSDELFAGYNRHWGEILSRYYRFVPQFLRDRVIMPLGCALPRAPLLKKGLRCMSLGDPWARYLSWHTVFTDELKRELLRLNGYNLQDTFTDVFQRYRKSATELNPLDRMLLFDIKVWLPDDLLMKKDKMGMATSVEARVPFLDHRFMELAFQIPSELKVKRLVTKYILKKSMEKLLPREIIYRKKEGFPTPISDWFRKELREYIFELLCSPGCLPHGYFNSGVVKRLVDEHITGKQDHHRLLFPLLNFELWYRTFCRTQPASL